MADDPHAVAIAALFATDPNLTAYDGRVPDQGAASAYVVYYLTVADEGSDDLTFAWERDQVRIYTHSVAQTPAGCRIVANRVRALLGDRVLTVSGREAWPIRHEATVPPMRNESLGYAVYDQADTWVVCSQPV